jgi:hypothetical protein
VCRKKFQASWAFIFLIVSVGAATAHADADNTPSGNAPAPSDAPSDMTTTPKKKKNTIPDADAVDDLITNNNLRAYSGSVSRWSIASQFNYNGGTISSPLSQDRPDISGASGTTTKSDLDGSISAKFNINAKNSLLAGFGVRWIAPLSGGPSNYDGSTYDAMNPYITYQYIYKWFGIQSVLQTQFMQWTQSDQTALGYGQQINIDQENMYDIGKTNISVGASVAVQYQWFNKTGSYGDPNSDNYVADLGTVQSQYLFTIAPEIEYQLTEKVNLRTLISLWTYEHYVSAPNFSFVHDTIYQSIGVGYSVTRDIFLYPNIQFLPGQLEASETNIGLTATVNLF